jgi:hypothetical protein
MISDLDIYRSANVLIREHGDPNQIWGNVLLQHYGEEAALDAAYSVTSGSST